MTSYTESAIASLIFAIDRFLHLHEQEPYQYNIGKDSPVVSMAGESHVVWSELE